MKPNTVITKHPASIFMVWIAMDDQHTYSMNIYDFEKHPTSKRFKILLTTSYLYTHLSSFEKQRFELKWTSIYLYILNKSKINDSFIFDSTFFIQHPRKLMHLNWNTYNEMCVHLIDCFALIIWTVVIWFMFW